MIRNQQYLYPKFPSTAVVKLLQYSSLGSNTRMGFIRTKDLSEVKNGEFGLDFKVVIKNRGVDGLKTENKMKKNKKKNSLKHWATGFRS